MSRRELAEVMRPARTGDLPQLFAILRGEIARGRQDVFPNEGRVARLLAGFDWEARSRVVVRDGRLVGGAFVVSRPSPEGVQANVYAGGETDVYRELVRWGAGFARAAGADAIQVFVSRARRGDLAGLGLEPARRWLRMDRTLTGPLPSAVPVDGYALVDGASAAGTWARTFNQAFADHWRFSPRSDDEIAGGKDPRLCLMAVHERTPVALTLGEVEWYEDDPRPQPVGLVSSVGTVPGHRRRGLAAWLVTEMLLRLCRAGARHASLYVDGDNAMRPFDLYEKLGFVVAFEAEVWEASTP